MSTAESIEKLRAQHRLATQWWLEAERKDPLYEKPETIELFNGLHILVEQMNVLCSKLRDEQTESQRLEALAREVLTSLHANKCFEREMQRLVLHSKETGTCYVCDDQGTSSCSICSR